jgi:hypothetical protein
MQQFVFGYGSLAADGAAAGEPARLGGHRRVWGVAMDNRVVLPGYKSYVDPATGERPAIFVAFLDIEPDRSAVVDGICIPVDDELLAALDARERNYDRHDVTPLMADPPGRVWAYAGSAEGRERLAEGRRTGTAVISREHLELCRAEPDGLPVHDLVRIDHADGHNPWRAGSSAVRAADS